MTGVIVQVNVSAGGIPKRAVAPAEVTEAGIVGDAWRFPFHGGQRKAILLITTRASTVARCAWVSVFVPAPR